MARLDRIRANLTVVTAWHRPFYVMALPRPDRGIDRATCINAMSIEVARSSRTMTMVRRGVNGLKQLKLARMRLDRATRPRTVVSRPPVVVTPILHARLEMTALGGIRPDQVDWSSQAMTVKRQ